MPSMPSTFRGPHQPDREDVTRKYDKLRGSARARGYSARWDKTSKGYLARHVMCAACAAAGMDEAARVTDHIVPHRGDMALFWNKNNWQPCCRWHHDVVKQSLEHSFGCGRLVSADLLLTSSTALTLAASLRGVE